MKTFITSDLHLGQHNIYRFCDKFGNRLRSYADNADDGDEYIIECWNSVVSPTDKVYVLGDVVITRKTLPKLDRLHGRKVLIRGNHDIFKLSDYAKYFKDIRGTHKLDAFILSHYPIHEHSLPVWCKANIHGHLHGDTVGLPKYFNVCIDNYEKPTPIDFEYIRNLYTNV